VMDAGTIVEFIAVSSCSVEEEEVLRRGEK
jgi:hypothetical protein